MCNDWAHCLRMLVCLGIRRFSYYSGRLLGKKELILVLFVRLFDLCLFGFVGFLFLLVFGIDRRNNQCYECAMAGHIASDVGLLRDSAIQLLLGKALEEERSNLSAFRTFVRFVLVWFCRFLGVWEGLRFVIVAFPGLFS